MVFTSTALRRTTCCCLCRSEVLLCLLIWPLSFHYLYWFYFETSPCFVYIYSYGKKFIPYSYPNSFLIHKLKKSQHLVRRPVIPHTICVFCFIRQWVGRFSWVHTAFQNLSLKLNRVPKNIAQYCMYINSPSALSADVKGSMACLARKHLVNALILRRGRMQYRSSSWWQGQESANQRCVSFCFEFLI